MTTNLLDRYLAGEHEPVWRELLAAGPAVRQAALRDPAEAVARETMRRVRHNCELLVSRLRSLGYQFGVYPDGSRGYSSDGPLVAPSDEIRADLAEVERRAGPVPLSLRTFWLVVGSVDLIGYHRSWPREGADPLVVYPPVAMMDELDAWEEMVAEGEASDEPFEGGLAPDDLHKDNISGGSPYAVALPDPSADFRFRNERHNLYFVSYLRLAILKWGGFPGLDAVKDVTVPLPTLLEGLLPF